MSPTPLRSRLLGALLPFALFAVGAPAAAQEAAYDFAASPKDGQFFIYRMNRETGEMGYCWYDTAGEGDIGQTVCAGAGRGGGAQAPGAYRLVAAPGSGQSAVFRVNEATGDVSVCYWNNGVVCTPAK